MIFKLFRVNVIVRVLLLAGIIGVFEFVWRQEEWPMTKLFFIIGIVLLVIELIHYVEKTNRDLRSFLLAIKHKDFTHSFSSERRGRSFSGLKDAFNQIMKGYQDLRAEKESHYQYLQNVIEHVSVALICYGDEGEVLLMNQAAQELLDRPYMSNIRILARVNEELLSTVREINTGDRKLVKTLVNEELLSLSLQATEFKLQGQNYKLVSFQDIGSELDEQEIDTWQKLIRVLTHEIMNSVTPIISLTKIIHGLLADEHGMAGDWRELDAEDSDDIVNSLRTIESRSKGLLHFVHAYRSLTKIQKPRFSPVNSQELIGRVHTLLKPEMVKRGIGFEFKCPEAVPVIQADAELIEQVLINLVKNAMEAIEGQKAAKIVVAVWSNEDRTHIQVRDNGPGIHEEYADKIFIPFFTTKKKGSGIGLSLSRQIMRLHRGSINFQSGPEGTSFTLTF